MLQEFDVTKQCEISHLIKKIKNESYLNGSHGGLRECDFRSVAYNDGGLELDEF